ncbi:hypothetical protein CTAYLR_000994 [Chrysophaeum taylorii]|uniref:DNAJC9 HTH domain-containing protein n=1 Tax=Chrysophaeum taylorii TaxID=2483200 RepID=A0AAD7UF93_9STRA|nr:hypothetical protein CTAYLR_000994 [Chrysophaeum taylorii]
MEDFVSGYKESEAEVADLVSFVSRTKGDVSRILEAIIGSDDFDPPRYVEIIEQAFRDGKILGKFRKKFDETKTAILSLSDLEGEDLSSSSSCSGEKGAPQEVGTTDLVALIAARRKEREQKFEEFAQKWQAVSEAENNNNNNNNPASSSSLSSKKRKRRRPKKKAP